MLSDFERENVKQYMRMNGKCPACNGVFTHYLGHVAHLDGCRFADAFAEPAFDVQAGGVIEKQRPEEQYQHHVTSLGAKRFQKADSPYETPASDAIEAALAAIREEPVDHVIVIVSKDHGDGSTNTRFFNAGSMNSLAQFGMLQSALNLMMKGSNP